MSTQSERLLQAIGDIDPHLAQDAAPLDVLPKKRRPVKIRWLAMAASAAALLVGTAFAAQQLFGSWIVNVEHDGAYHTQKAYSDVQRFTADDFSENILFSPEGEGFWNIGLDSWDEMEDYLGRPLAHNPFLDDSPTFLGGVGEPTRCSIEIRYCEHGDQHNAYRYKATGRDMSPYADQLEYVTVQSSHLVEGARVTLFGTFYTELDFEHNPWPLPFHEEEFPDGTLSEYTLPNGTNAVVFHPTQGVSGSHPEAWFVYEGALYYIILSEAPEQYAPEGCSDWEAALYKVLEGFS